MAHQSSNDLKNTVRSLNLFSYFYSAFDYTMGKRKKCISLMKDWPEEEQHHPSYDELLSPLKKIVYNGYKLRRLPNNQFLYNGYNIGEAEYSACFPTPEERFSPRWLENENRHNRTLMDNVLVTAFQLGIEKGRRLSKTNCNSTDLLEDIIKARTETVRRLRDELSKYDASYCNEPVPLESDNQDLIIEEFEPDC